MYSLCSSDNILRKNPHKLSIISGHDSIGSIWIKPIRLIISGGKGSRTPQSKSGLRAADQLDGPPSLRRHFQDVFQELSYADNPSMKQSPDPQTAWRRRTDVFLWWNKMIRQNLEMNLQNLGLPGFNLYQKDLNEKWLWFIPPRQPD